MESLYFEFHPNDFGKNNEKKLSDGLSAVIYIGNELWVANDETVTLERLLHNENKNEQLTYGGEGKHFRYDLQEYISVPVASPDSQGEIEEIDIEGLDHRDGFIWIAGSHSAKRGKPNKNKSENDNVKHLAEVVTSGNRFLIARIPLVLQPDGNYMLDKANAATLSGNATENELTIALRDDIHLAPFLKIPSKDNGFDIEGLAVGENGRTFLGLRGPVLCGMAIILELQLSATQQSPSDLNMNIIDADGSNYRKHFLDLNGLGIRDICIQGEDLLILAGPTMKIDGLEQVFRWKNGAKQVGGRVVWADSDELKKVIDIPYEADPEKDKTDTRKDHAEGITAFRMEGEQLHSLLVVYDNKSKSRQVGENIIRADIFEIEN